MAKFYRAASLVTKDKCAIKFHYAFFVLPQDFKGLYGRNVYLCDSLHIFFLWQIFVDIMTSCCLMSLELQEKGGSFKYMCVCGWEGGHDYMTSLIKEFPGYFFLFVCFVALF